MLHAPLKAAQNSSSQALIGVLSNCASTTNRVHLSQVRALVSANPHVFHFEFENIDDIAEGLAMMADAGVALLIINGGDGTIQATLSRIINDKPFTVVPPLAILPGGKTNMIADDLRAKGKPDKVLSRLIRLVRTGKLARHLTRRHLIGLEMSDGHPTRYGMFFGGAAIVNGILWSRNHIHTGNLPTRLGHAVAIVKLVLETAFSAKPSPMRSSHTKITLGDDQSHEGEFNVILATTLSRLLMRLRPFGRKGDGPLQISLIQSRPGVMCRALFALLTGRFDKGTVKGLHTARVDDITIHGPDPVTLDGEIYYPNDGRPIILQGNKALNFVRL
ncbi:diacylglycerol kinase [Iodidimonas gelatinilytica]|uniref:Diacylglycerol kinase n=3 Tax=Iodidimonas gelatinilytica TaxID=1236966 RepID=A0A5A7MY72_9PROT|nr:diacylglycerol kinase family protein [Iodidimonas gelatinilytica]GER00375.1 diacylglycerol kinase [Iodidimonas gelatinilytica]